VVSGPYTAVRVCYWDAKQQCHGSGLAIEFETLINHPYREKEVQMIWIPSLGEARRAALRLLDRMNDEEPAEA
jgi:hypothetical protein